MNTKHLLSLIVLGGALATTSVATADSNDHDRRSYQAEYDYRYQERLDVIEKARLTGWKGTIEWRIRPQQRRDGLALVANNRDVRIIAIDLEYSDGRLERLRDDELRTALRDDGFTVIQRGRPPGLRVVTVRYSMKRADRYANLKLVQLHDEDRYYRRDHRSSDDPYDHHDDDHDGYYDRYDRD